MLKKVGSAPLIVALVSVTVLGVHLAPLELLAIVMIAAAGISGVIRPKEISVAFSRTMEPQSAVGG